jgi:hypothetical protein
LQKKAKVFIIKAIFFKKSSFALATFVARGETLKIGILKLEEFFFEKFRTINSPNKKENFPFGFSFF